MDYRQRRKEQAQQTEQAILQAAMELARENSFDKVSVRDICQRAGITTGAFTTTSVPGGPALPWLFPPGPAHGGGPVRPRD
mgnify:CR=1 FL=1